MKNPRLIATTGTFKGKVFVLTRQPFTVGRNADNSLCLLDLLVSGYHFRIQLEDDGAVLYDRETRNGTWIDQQHYRQKVLEHGDRIRCGNATFVYLEREDPLDGFENLAEEIREEEHQYQETETLRADSPSRDPSYIYIK